MFTLRFRLGFACCLLVAGPVWGWSGIASAEDAETNGQAAPAAEQASVAEIQNTTGGGNSGGGGSAGTNQSSQPDHAAVLKDLERLPGLITLYHKDSRLIAELTPQNLNTDFIVLASISRGIGRNMLLAGMYANLGDDWIWQFRKAEDRIHVVRRNVRFTAKAGSPESRAVELAYTDSVLFSLPILAKGPGGGDLVDLSSIFMTDLPQLSRSLRGYTFTRARSTWQQAKSFPDNVELEVSATYASSGTDYIDSVPDTRGVTINVHYSISKLPSTGYQPRLADNRVGYFITAVKDFSRSGDDDRFVRYINRWDLRKADASADLSPPRKPIIFWLEKTIPYRYRKPIREGIEEWNKAFEKAGFVNAIEVRQQPDNADWDPEDINYNTFRWITAGAGFAIGPSRVNPLTGEILNADILFDADFIESWRNEFETFTPESIANLTGGPLDLRSYQEHLDSQPHGRRHHCMSCQLSHGYAAQLAFGAAMLANRNNREEEFDKMVMQGLKDVAMHEVGHTLGLRHNFRAASFLSLEDLQDTRKTARTGLSASVMDYLPVNIMPAGKKQGDYFSQTIGPYDYWAIEYGYKSVSGGSPDAEYQELKKIAARSGEPGLQYATDEDARGIDPDPLTHRWMLGDDPVAFARMRAELVAQQIPELLENVVEEGESWDRVRLTLNALLAKHGTAMFAASRTVGGIYMSRSHRGDEKAPPPFVIVESKRQRETLELLEEQIFSDKPFQLPPELYNHLTPSRWNHWGASRPVRTDYPVHEVISMWQDRIMQQLMSSLTLTRLHDSELRVPNDEETFTAAELIERLTRAVFQEVDKLEPGEYTVRAPAISSLRRNLQRTYLRRLSDLAMGHTDAPHDCRTIAFVELQDLQARIDKLMEKEIELDSYSRAHLQETSSRIGKVLDARLQLRSP